MLTARLLLFLPALMLGDLETELRWVETSLTSLVRVSSWTTAVNTGPLLVLLVVKVRSPLWKEGWPRLPK